ncbi:MAG: hypothetical protein Q8P48_11020 [Deltaproteobacteria bacterium]|nr:hypothetical protein [Deltaproteobacteria bacterium]
MKPKQGRTSNEDIQAKIDEVRRVIRGPKTRDAAVFLRGWAGSFEVFADDLEGRDDHTINGGDHDVLHWPAKLREVAEEAERAAGVFEKAPADRLPEESMYPGMKTE